ncbi:GNAT family N-acetyltransferase [Oerskovia sp. NPDC057915]|uniref:GNAT family N-acetyltransferase n=1 Tax=Oerskovia sp. NPDC057915 TaxID=3346280 RepID=UPI0036DAAC0F
MRPVVTVRPARPDDADAMASVHVESWQQTYRGLMRDEVLDDPDLLPARRRFWRAVLTEERYGSFRAAVAVDDDTVVGIALAGPATDPDVTWDAQLYVLYLLEAFHGSGAGHGLMNAVLPGGDSAALWVADPNPRAQAFYAKQGFEPDGVVKVEDGVSEVRLVRTEARVDPGN